MLSHEFVSNYFVSDDNIKTIGLSINTLEKLCEGSGLDFDKFDVNVRKNLSLPTWANTMELFGIYAKHLTYSAKYPSIMENIKQSQNNIQQELFSKFKSITNDYIKKVKIGDKVSLLSLGSITIPGDKVYARLRGFTSPREVVDIVKNKNYFELKFSDGSKFPETDDIISMTQSQIMTRALDPDTASQIVTYYATLGNTVNSELDFKIEVDINVLEDSMSLRDWFGKGKHGGAGGGGWDRYNTKGERIGKCGERSPGEGKPKCLSKSRAASLRASGGKKAIAAAVRKKRREDPNPERRGKADMVSNKTRTNK